MKMTRLANHPYDKKPEKGGDINTVLNRKECLWIDRLRSIHHGLNRMEELNSMITL